MPVSNAAINEQVKRLLRLPFSPKEREDEDAWKKEFSRIIKARCDNDEHAIAVVTRLMETSHRCPEPAAVVEACGEVDVPEADKAPGGCELCQGIGFQQYGKRDKFGSSVDVSDYCICGLGQWLKAKHKQYREEQAQGVKRSTRKTVEATVNQFIRHAPYIPDCELCEDYGHLDDPVTKLRIWCKCGVGIQQAGKYPGLVDALNKKVHFRNLLRKPITQADIEAQVRKREAK